MPEEAVVAEVEEVLLADLLDRVRVGRQAVAVRVGRQAVAVRVGRQVVAVRVVLILLVAVALEAVPVILPAPVQPLDRAHLVRLLIRPGVKLGDGLAVDLSIDRR
jgi:hypothetical protein